MEIVLTIAGSDPSAGAGIQQDLKTISAMGCYGATVITAVTSQNTLGVQGVMPVPKETVKSQIRSVLDDLDVKAVKIGMIPNKAVAEAIVEELLSDDATPSLRRRDGMAIILDPVMISTSGTRLMAEDCIDYIRRELMPHCLLVTPNIPESKILPPPYPTNFLVKGGHGDGEDMTDTLIMTDGKEYQFSTKRIATSNLHGTGCTLSSAIACGVAKGEPLPEAVKHAKDFITKAIENAKDLKIGHGNGPLQVFSV